MLKGTVVYVQGNHVGVRLDSGETKDYQVPDDRMVMVDGKEISFRDLKPGTRLTRTIKTVTQPKTVITTEVKRGTVWHVQGRTLIVKDENGENKKHVVPSWFKFNVDGEEKTVGDLKKGMELTATIVSEEKVIVARQTQDVSGTAPVAPKRVAASPAATRPAPAPAARPAAPASAAAPAPAPAPAALPLLGLLGSLALVGAFGVKILRKRLS